ncbi:MAG: hypothetical protein KDB23_24490 [Planctomycetales bacterium]|nr:hypothetical protein [Planctomycetales bacterium]
MALSHWRIFTDTKTPEAARRVIARLQARVDRSFGQMTVNDYHKGGHEVTFDFEHEIDDWASTVYDVISCAQQMGHGWSINGSIEEELNLTGTVASISGVKMVSCYCPRPGTPNAK